MWSLGSNPKHGAVLSARTIATTIVTIIEITFDKVMVANRSICSEFGNSNLIWIAEDLMLDCMLAANASHLTYHAAFGTGELISTGIEVHEHFHLLKRKNPCVRI